MNSSTEPAADLRAAAAFYWQMFVALKAEGFTEEQALQLLGITISSAMGQHG